MRQGERIRRLWQALDQWAARGQSYLLPVLIVFIAAAGLLFVVSLASLGRRAASDRPGQLAITIRTPFAEPPLTPAFKTLADAAPETPIPIGTILGVPSIDWQDDDRLRHAASVLLVHHEYDAAVELLLQEKAKDSYAFVFNKAAYLKAMDLRDRTISNECDRLKAAWEKLPLDQKRRLCGAADPKLVDILATLRQVRPDAARLGAELPETVFFFLMCNVHVELVKSAQAHPQLVALLLEPEFPEDGFARRTFRQHLPEQRMDYTRMGR